MTTILEADERGALDSNEHLASDFPSRSNTTENSTEKEPVIPENGRPPFSFLREVIFVATIASSQILMQSGISQGLAPALFIGQHFGIGNNAEMSWYVASFSLTVGTFILIAGRLGDMYGHKRMFIIGYLLYGLWSMIAGASYYVSTDKLFIICRAFQGASASIILPNGIAILGRTYPPGMRKNMVFSLFGAAAPSGFMIGAVFSSLIAQSIPWLWAYFIMGIVCFVAAFVSIWSIPVKNVAHGGKFDFLGSISGVAGLILFNVAWNQGPTVGWRTPSVYVYLILGVLAMAIFVFVERRAENPLVPVDVVNVRIGLTLTALFAGWASFGIWIFYFWAFSQALRGCSSLLVVAQISPATISGLVSAVVAGLLIPKIGVPPLMVIALTAFCLATVLLATMPVDQTYWAATFVASLVMPWGMEMSFPTATIMASAAVPAHRQGIAASMVLTTANYAISFGLGIAGTVVSNVSTDGDVLAVCRYAWYTGIGISGVGIIIAVVSTFYHWKRGIIITPH